MKKHVNLHVRKIFVIISILIVITIIFEIVKLNFTKKINLNFAEQITLNYEHVGKSIHVNITDNDDFERLINLCQGTAVNDFSVPSCGFGAVEIEFKGNGQEYYIYPACDGCTTMRFGKEDKFFCYPSEENRAELIAILSKYGATFPCV